MKKIVIIVLMFTLSTCAIVVHVSMPTIRLLGYMYILLSAQAVDAKKEVLTYYEEDKNIILPKEFIDVKYFYPKYIIDFKIKNNRIDSKIWLYNNLILMPFYMYIIIII